MRATRRPSWLSVAALLLLGMATLGAVEHQAMAELPAAVEGEHVETGHAEPDGSLHLDPASLDPHHHCVVCWLGSKSQVTTSGVRLQGAAAAGSAVSPDTPAVAAGWLASAPSRAPPLC